MDFLHTYGSTRVNGLTLLKVYFSLDLDIIETLFLLIIEIFLRCGFFQPLANKVKSKLAS